MIRFLRIAVLPFVNLSPEAQNEFFSDGLTEEIINALTQVPALRVTARTSSFAFKGQNKDIREIGQTLGVQTILEGSVRQANEKIRITAQLIDVADGFHYWSANFDGSTSNLFSLQDEVSLEIADRVRAQFGHFEIQDHFEYGFPQTLNAYQWYLKGNYHFHQSSPQGFQQALACYTEAVTQEPTFALALAHLSETYSNLGLFQLMSKTEAYPLALQYAQKAVDLKPDQAECQLALAFAYFCQDWHVRRAVIHIQKAYALNPHHARVKAIYGIYRAAATRYQQGIEEIRSALLSDPYSISVNAELAVIHLMRQEYEACLERAEVLLKINPLFVAAYYLKGRVLFQKGEYQAAREVFSHLPFGENQQADWAWMACCDLKMGKKDEALELIAREPLPVFRYDPNLYYYPRILHHLLSRQERLAMDLLQEAVPQHPYTLLGFYLDPAFQPLRQFPEFQRLEAQYQSDFELPDFGSPNRYQNSPLKASQIQQIRQQLREHMEVARPYLNPDLSLRELAQQLEVHPNYLSQVINETQGQNFFTYVNTYRVEAFKTRLQSSTAKHYTLLAHAYECGFSSKTTFNTTFRKLTGQTPSQYQKSLRAAQKGSDR
jgi:adenylate cyclase